MPVTNPTNDTPRARAFHAPPGPRPRRRDAVFRTAAQGSVAVSLLWAVPAQAADRVEALLLQLRQQLEQDQRQIQGLTRQVDELSKRVAQTPVIPAPGVPDSAARNVVVMQQPGNLPGRTVGPPNTAGGVGPPGAPAPVASAPISSGTDKIRVSLSGQVDRAILYGNDGKSSNF